MTMMMTMVMMMMMIQNAAAAADNHNSKTPITATDNSNNRRLREIPYADDLVLFLVESNNDAGNDYDIDNDKWQRYQRHF